MTATKPSALSCVKLKVTLKARGPIVTRSSSIGAPGIDAPMASRKFLNPATGKAEQRYYIPGSLIKGMLREAWTELGFHDHCEKWLGRGSDPEVPGDEEADVPKRGLLWFGDFADFATELKRELRFRIEIDEARGAAANAMLQVIDSPYAPFDEPEFRGEIRWLANAESEIDAAAEAIQRGLLWVRAIGGAKTSGFGEMLGVKTETSVERMPAACSLEGARWDLRLRFAEPVILSKRRVAENLFESADILPGGSIKGAIASAMARDPDSFRALARDLHRVRFTHAFPAKAGQPRPRQAPLSLAEFSGEKEPRDMLAEVAPPDVDRALKFDIDWKEEMAEHVAQQYGWPRIETELRVRTAIDPEKRRADDGKLFAWQMLAPYGYEWKATVETDGISHEAREQLERLLRFGVGPLGKTKALAEASIQSAGAPHVAQAESYAVVLQTPALLLNPENLIGSSSERDLEREYGRAWDELSGGALELAQYFQRCSLTGGEYFEKRFHLKRDQYKPYLLCDAGCAFLLKPVAGRESDARDRLALWVKRGIPIAKSLCAFYKIPEDEASQWRHCPYLPENGYGEVAIEGRVVARSEA
jgi:hypothetical protein